MEKKLMTFSNFWVKFVLIWDIKFHLHSNVKYTLKCILYYLFIKIYNISLHWVYFSLKNSWRKFFPWNKFRSYLLVCNAELCIFWLSFVFQCSVFIHSVSCRDVIPTIFSEWLTNYSKVYNFWRIPLGEMG